MHDLSVCSKIANYLCLFLDQKNPLSSLQCKWHQKLDTDWTLYDDKIVNQLRHFFPFNDAMFAALCSKIKDLIKKWLNGFMILVHLCWTTSQAKRVYLNNGRRWKIAQKQVSVLVQQYKKISLPLECQSHWEALIVAEASMSQWPLSIQDFCALLHFVCVFYNILLCESKLSELI